MCSNRMLWENLGRFKTSKSAAFWINCGSSFSKCQGTEQAPEWIEYSSDIVKEKLPWACQFRNVRGKNSCPWLSGLHHVCLQ